MIDIAKDIHSLTEFKRNTSEFVRQIKETKHPLVLTVNGKAELVVQDAESYQELLEAADFKESVKSIRRALEQVARGDGRPADEVIASLRHELGIIDE
jgi:prevent-host-death family protein